MAEEVIGNWIECVVDSDYEIYSEYPYPIRRKGKDKIIKESIDGHGYIICKLNGKIYPKHRIIAIQFIENDDPEHKIEVDHINHNRSDNRIENLRWVTRSENDRNKSSNRGIQYEFINELPENYIELSHYGNHTFEFYYYVPDEDSFYFYTGAHYRKLYVNTKKGNEYIYARDSEGNQIQVFLNKFKKLYELI